MIGPKGKFMLEPGDERTHLFISTGTGNAPFISMMKRCLEQGAPRKTVFLNGVSYARDLGYRDLVEGWQASGEYPVTYVPTVSRPDDPSNAGWTGRVGRTEAILARHPRRARAHAATLHRLHLRQPGHDPRGRGTLPERGFPEEQVRKELYWPKGKEPTGE